MFNDSKRCTLEDILAAEEMLTKPVEAFFDAYCLIKDNAMYFSEDIRYIEWAKVGRRLRMLSDNLGWYYSDWIRHGLEKFGYKKCKHLIKKISIHKGLAYKKLHNLSKVFSPEKRKYNLKINHYLMLVLIHDDYERDKWMTRCLIEKWTSNQLRLKMAQAGLIKSKYANYESDIKSFEEWYVENEEKIISGEITKAQLAKMAFKCGEQTGQSKSIKAFLSSKEKSRGTTNTKSV